MYKRDEVLGFLRANKDYFFFNFMITKIGVFGSFGREEQNENCDLDILIEFEEGTSDLFEKKQVLKDFLSHRFQISVDVCREKSIKPVFLSLIMKDLIYA